MKFPDFDDFVCTLGPDDLDLFEQAFNSAARDQSLPAAYTALTLRVLAAYHDWLAEELESG